MPISRIDYVEQVRRFTTFAAIYEYLAAKPYSSFKDIATHLGGDMTPQKISTFLDDIEGRYGELLVNRTARSKNNSLRPAADQLYKQAKEFLRDLGTWPRRGPEEIRIGAPNLMIHAVFPKILSSCRRNLAKLGQEVDIRIQENPTEVAQTIDKVADGSLHMAFIWLHGDRLGKIRQLADSLGAKDVKLEPAFGAGFDIVMICPPGHRFVEEAKFDSAKGAWRLDLDELAHLDDLVYSLPSHRQPLYGHIRSKNMVFMNNYETIISTIRCHYKEGIGVVPGIYPILGELHRKGQLFYAPIDLDNLEPHERKIAIGCLTKGGLAKLDGPARYLFGGETESKISQLCGRGYTYARSVLIPLPSSIMEYYEFKHCYFVMQHEETFGVPRWFSGELLWEPGSHSSPPSGGHVEGRLTGHLEGTFKVRTRQDYKFIANGWLRTGVNPIDRLFQFVGEGDSPNQKNTIICTFNMRVSYEADGEIFDAIVGMWSGRDDSGLATVAPMLLSQVPIPDVGTMRLIVNKVSSRCLPNAEIGDDERLPESTT